MLTQTVKMRFLQAVIFEAVAICTLSPLAAWMMNKPLFQMGGLAFILSALALVWNMVYNSTFDYFCPRAKVKRTLFLRIMHALGFEGGFILIGLPVVAWWLNIGLRAAFLMEVAFFLLFLPYTFLFNWLWDRMLFRLVPSSEEKN